jgi:hypothetical protein
VLRVDRAGAGLHVDDRSPPALLGELVDHAAADTDTVDADLVGRRVRGAWR